MRLRASISNPTFMVSSATPTATDSLRLEATFRVRSLSPAIGTARTSARIRVPFLGPALGVRAESGVALCRAGAALGLSGPRRHSGLEASLR